jgi:L-fucose isomerase-like protein
VSRVKVGFVPLHRHPFDEKWAIELKERFIAAVKAGFRDSVELVYPSERDTKMGLVSDDDDAETVAELFRREGVDGIAIAALTFGDELAGARVAELVRKPVVIYATKEPPALPGGFRRSDSFCGTLSLASALYRRKIPFLFGGIVLPEEEGFRKSFDAFVRAANVVKVFVGAKVGAIGPRPERFETVTFNEAAMAAKFNQRVVHVDLLEVVEEARKLGDNDPRVAKVVEEVARQLDASVVPREALVKLAKLEVVLRELAERRGLVGLGLRCWTELQRFYGVTPCLVMGRLTDSGVMAACEVDVYGALTMAMQYAASLGRSVPFFIDWTIKHPTRENVFLAWHCGNMPPSLCHGVCRLGFHSVMYREVGAERSYGTVDGRMKPGTVTISRLVEYDGEFKLFLTKGRIVEEPGEFRGSWAWVEVPDLDRVYRTLIEEGFVHHASMIHGDLTEPLTAAAKLLGVRVVMV